MSGLVSIKGVPSWELDRHWNALTRFIISIDVAQRRFCPESDRIDAITIYNRIKSSDWQLWLVFCGSVLTGTVLTGIELNSITGAKELTIYWVSGERIRETLPTYNYIEDWAKSQGCSLGKTRVRPAIVRLMKLLGYYVQQNDGKSVWMIKEFTNGR